MLWHAFVAQMETQRQRLVEGRNPVWGLPPTMPNDQRVLSFSQHSSTVGSGLVAIDAAEAETADALADVLRQVGYATAWLGTTGKVDVRGAAAVVWDGGASPLRRIDQAATVVERFSPAPVLALLDFPRSQDLDAAYSAGVSAVVGKPFLLGELCWRLGNLIEQRSLSTVRYAA